MLNSGKKNLRFARQNKNILTLVLSKKFFLNETKNHNPPPPFKLNGWSLIIPTIHNSFIANNRIDHEVKLAQHMMCAM